LLFRSQQKLTSYENQGRAELYRYESASGRLACMSCDPTGAPPVVPATLRSIKTPTEGVEASIVTRNLSADGSKVFFESQDPLVAADTNGTQDVYEWEQEGTDTCTATSETFSGSSGGCLYLISGGRSPDRSFFADASPSGNDVFFYTHQALVGQDQDDLLDIYDARVNGGIEEQNPPVASACAEESCRGPSASAPLFGMPASATFSGLGNVAPSSASPAKRAEGPSKGRALTSRQNLARALAACRKKTRRSRIACERQARKRYGRLSTSTTTSTRGK
jgi:hypothetical protein